MAGNRKILMALALLVGVGAMGCATYPGLAVTKVTYYDPATGKKIAEVEQTTSWRQASVTAPGPLPELQPLAAHSEEYALALSSFYENRGQALPTDLQAHAAVAEAFALRAAVDGRAVLVDHKPVSADLGAMAGAAIGALMAWLTGGIL